MSDFLFDHFPLFLFGGLAILFGVLMLGGDFMAERSCRIFSDATGSATKYYRFDTCYVQRDGRWWHWDEYKLAYATTADAVTP